MLGNNEKVTHVIFSHSNIDSKVEYPEDVGTYQLFLIICMGVSVFFGIPCDITRGTENTAYI